MIARPNNAQTDKLPSSRLPGRVAHSAIYYTIFVVSILENCRRARAASAKMSGSVPNFKAFRPFVPQLIETAIVRSAKSP